MSVKSFNSNAKFLFELRLSYVTVVIFIFEGEESSQNLHVKTVLCAVRKKFAAGEVYTCHIVCCGALKKSSNA